ASTPRTNVASKNGQTTCDQSVFDAVASNACRGCSAGRIGRPHNDRGRTHGGSVGTPLCRGCAAFLEELLSGLPRHQEAGSEARPERLHLGGGSREELAHLGPGDRAPQRGGDAAGESAAAP